MVNAIQGIEAVLEPVDKDCSLSEQQGRGSKGKPEETVEQILKDLIEVYLSTFQREIVIHHFQTSMQICWRVLITEIFTNG